MLRHPYPDAECLRQRLRERGDYIAHTTPEESARFLQSAAELGHILRAGRELLECSPSARVDLATQWLWEEGLALPTEVASGEVWRILSDMVEALSAQISFDPATRLMRDLTLVQSLLLAPEIERSE